MTVRLAFSVAIQVDADILLIDEVLAVGDAAFQQKCFDVFNRMREEGRTIVFVTHDIDESVYLGNRVIVLSGRPTTVRETFTIDLPFPRDQVTAKALPEFVKMRTKISQLIRSERSIKHAEDP